MTAPVLVGEALAAVRHRGSHLQIIAGAGSGKTEVVAQRVTDLLAEGAPSSSVIAFTFTERAADELKARITRRVEERLGQAGVDQLTGLYVGTIHGYCFRLLQQHVPRFESYDVLDDNRLTAFLVREARRLELRQFDDRNRLFTSVARFLGSLAVVENELIEPRTVDGPFGVALRAYYETLDRYRLLTYGQQIVQAVKALDDDTLGDGIRASLRHAIVDEYQDVNPAQERLIELLAGPEVHLCVVGDDQQAIYQWRGSDVANIVTFANRYGAQAGGEVARFTITVNRRSRPQLIAVANEFATTIPDRLGTAMLAHRDGAADSVPEIVVWTAQDEEEEAGTVTNLILDLAEGGTRFRDVAVLVRTRGAYKRLVETFATFDVPVQPGGRTGLFEQAEAVLLGKTFAWLSDIEWRTGFDYGRTVTDDELFGACTSSFALAGQQRGAVLRYLREWKEAVPGEGRQADLVGELYGLLGLLGVRDWDLTDAMQLNRVGTLARFSALLADYESVRRRARRDDEHEGEQIGGQDRGTWYYRNLALHLVNYAAGAYEGFDGEEDFDLDAIDLTTVHRAKGLEWPVVFVPSLTAKRFPTDRVGRPQLWLLPRERFDAARYEGSDADERRLFYVAITRARDWVSLSRHERVTRNAVRPSPYYQALSQLEVEPDSIVLPEIEHRADGDEDPIVLSYSQLAMFLECGHAFRMRDRIGFQPRLAPELGYGKAVHSVMRAVAQHTMATGRVPDGREVDTILDHSFFLPTASRPAHQALRESARRLIATYTDRYGEDLHRVWQTEYPFELHLDGVVISGRADVILDHEGDVPSALAIVDYKTSTEHDTADHDLQLQVYADAGRREGLEVRAAYVHDLKQASRDSVDVGQAALERAEQTVAAAAVSIRARDYRPNPGRRCRRCEVRTICPDAAR